MENMTHCTKMGADKSAENTLNAPKFISLKCLPKPKIWDFDEKRLHWVFVVCAFQNQFKICTSKVGRLNYRLVLSCFQFDCNKQLGIVMFLQTLKCVSSLDKNRQNQLNDARTSEKGEWYGLCYFILQISHFHPAIKGSNIF